MGYLSVCSLAAKDSKGLNVGHSTRVWYPCLNNLNERESLVQEDNLPNKLSDVESLEFSGTLGALRASLGRVW